MRPKGRWISRYNPVGLDADELPDLSRYAGRGDVPGATPIRSAQIQKAVRVAQTDLRASPFYLPKREPFAYQLAGAAFFNERVHFLRQSRGPTPYGVGIFDPMGLGKTEQAVASIALMSHDAYPALVVCPKVTISSWVATLEMGLRTKSEATKGQPFATVIDASRSKAKTLPDNAVVVVHYEGLADLLKRTPFQPRFLVLDEAHRCANPKTERMKILRPIIAKSTYLLALTGTPALMSSLGILPILHLIDGQPLENELDYKAWSVGKGFEVDAFGGYWDVKDYADAQRLKFRTKAARRSRLAVREAKATGDWVEGNADGRRFLQPLKLRELRKAVLLPAPKSLQQASDEALLDLLGRSDGYEDTMRLVSAASFEAKAALLRKAHTMRGASEEDFRKSARKANANFLKDVRQVYLPIPIASESDSKEPTLRKKMSLAVLDEAVELRRELPGDVVFYAYYVDAAERLARKIAEIAPSHEVYLYTGGAKYVMKDGKKSVIDDGDLSEAFARPAALPRTAIITDAAQVGVSLPSADHLVMLDRGNSPSIEDQIEDRINRAGRQGRSKIIYLLPDDVFTYALAHRLLSRRFALEYLYGEAGRKRITDDGEEFLVGMDYATPLRLPTKLTREQRATGHWSRSDGSRAGNFRALVYINYGLLQDPDAWFRRAMSEAWAKKDESSSYIEKETRELEVTATSIRDRAVGSKKQSKGTSVGGKALTEAERRAVEQSVRDDLARKRGLR